MIIPNSLMRDFRIKKLFSSSVNIAFIGFFMTIRFIDLKIAIIFQSHDIAQSLSLPDRVSAREWIGVDGALFFLQFLRGIRLRGLEGLPED